MTNWQWTVGPATGNETDVLTTAQSRGFTVRLTDPSEAKFTIPAQGVDASFIGQLTNDLHIYRDGVKLYRGRCFMPGRTLDPGSQPPASAAVSSFDYRAVLKRRQTYANSTLTFGQVDQARIAWTLINDSQARLGGNLGISPGVGATTGILRDRTYTAASSVGDLVQELSQVINGFDWEISPLMALNVYYPYRGVDNGVVLDYGGLVVRMSETTDVSTFANATRASGSSGLSDVVTEPASLATDPAGRWDGVWSDPDIVTQAELAEKAGWVQADSQTVTSVYVCQLRGTTQGGTPGWRGPAHIWVGDTVSVVVDQGIYQIQTVARVYEIAVEIDQAGKETVTVTVGGPRPDPRRRATKVQRTLAKVALV